MLEVVSCEVMGNAAIFILLSSYFVSSFIRPIILPQTLCPSLCFCKWKSGKQTAECVGQKIGFVPSELDEDTLVLDLSKNRFGTLVNRVFQRKGLVNLQKIYLSQSRIATVEPNAFFQLTNLIELDLGSNYLMSIPSDSFHDCPLLRRLVLSRNPIGNLSDSSFAMLRFLTFLDLSSCEIVYIHPDSFEGLPNLSVLKIDDNHLQTLSRMALEPLSVLARLELHNNPWNCDCELRQIRQWMIDRNIPLAAPPHCEEPKRLQGISWEFTTLEDFACLPIIFSPLTEVAVLSGQNISLECNVEANSKSTIYWEVHGNISASINSDHRKKYSIDVQRELNLTSRLTVFHMTEEDGNIYSCIAENVAGNSSLNFSITVVSTLAIEASWSILQIAIVGMSSVAVIAVAFFLCVAFTLYPSLLPTGPKFRRRRLFKRLQFLRRREEVDEMPVAEVQEDISVKSRKQEQENGESYDSEKLTPDLVTRIAEQNSELSSVACCSSSEPRSSTLNVRYGHALNTLSEVTIELSSYARPLERPSYTEIYPNPCDENAADMPSASIVSPFGCDISPSLQSSENVSAKKAFLPSTSKNLTKMDRMKSNSLKVSANVTHYALTHKSRFSPDEGYDEEALEGTDV